VGILLIPVALGAYFLWPKIAGTGAGGVPSKNAGDKTGPAVPVVAARSRKGDIGVYYTGLGTVTPISTVTVKSRVDGQLLKVQYREGELVHQGDVLAELHLDTANFFRRRESHLLPWGCPF